MNARTASPALTTLALFAPVAVELRVTAQFVVVSSVIVAQGEAESDGRVPHIGASMPLESWAWLGAGPTRENPRRVLEICSTTGHFHS